MEQQNQENPSVDHQILNQFHYHAHLVEFSKRCLEKVNLESHDAKYKSQLFNECVSSRINIINSLNH